eukprot:6181520-Pleurochrysis_carterae.AAC.5
MMMLMPKMKFAMVCDQSTSGALDFSFKTGSRGCNADRIPSRCAAEETAEQSTMKSHVCPRAAASHGYDANVHRLTLALSRATAVNDGTFLFSIPRKKNWRPYSAIEAASVRIPIATPRHSIVLNQTLLRTCLSGQRRHQRAVLALEAVELVDGADEAGHQVDSRVAFARRPVQVADLHGPPRARRSAVVGRAAEGRR